MAQRKVHGGGMVLDWGVHMLDQIMMMVEKPLRSVYAILSHVTNDDVDDGFDYLNGADLREVNRAAFSATFQAHSERLPCVRLKISELNEYSFGQLFYFLNLHATFPEACWG